MTGDHGSTACGISDLWSTVSSGVHYDTGWERDDTEFPGTLIVQLSSCVSRGDDESGKRVQNVLNGLKFFKNEQNIRR